MLWPFSCFSRFNSNTNENSRDIPYKNVYITKPITVYFPETNKSPVDNAIDWFIHSFIHSLYDIYTQELVFV